MATVPKKNISPVIADVRRPAREDRGAEERGKELGIAEEARATRAAELFFERPRVSGEYLPTRPGVHFKKFVLLLCALLALAVFGAGAFLYYSDRTLLGYSAESFRELQAGLQRVGALETGEAAARFAEIQSDVDRRTAQSSLFSYGRDMFPGLFPFLEDGVSAIRDLKGIITEGIALAGELDLLTRSFPDYLLTQRGGELIASLERVRGRIQEVNAANGALAQRIAKLDSSEPAGGVFPFRVELVRLSDFLGPLIAWLKSEEPNHLAVFFENPSELRPGGGFIGSYADVSIAGGNIENIEVHDINDPDREFSQNIIPPAPLQALVTRWRAADANWFFDFSQSAPAVLRFLEGSELYRKRGVSFDGAIGLSARAVADLLEITGPIEVRGVRLTAENFIREIQSEVIAERGKKSPDPKEILKELTPAVIQKVAALDDAGRAQAFSSLAESLRRRDVAFYFKDPAFQSFLDYYGWTRRSFAVPQNFFGDYVAIAEANIGGGKTDAVMSRTITVESQIEADGTVRNRIAIERRHGGDKRSEWWYRSANQAYIKVLTPLAAKAVAFQGAEVKTITPRANYATGGYAKDAAVAAIETTLRDNPDFPALQSFKEEGKNVFGFWTKVEKGKAKTVTLEYTRKLPGAPAPGQTYEFVFERQSGSSGKYRFEIGAPVGYRWRENGLALYTFESDDPDGRVVIELTLMKN